MLDLKSQLGLEVRQVGNLGPVGHILEDVIGLNEDFENLNDSYFIFKFKIVGNHQNEIIFSNPPH